MNDPISTPQVPPIPLVPAEILHALTVAHAEIDRLRSLTRFQDGVIRSGDTACLTQAERDDLACAASRLESDPNGPRDLQVADTLRGLLERLGGGR